MNEQIYSNIRMSKHNNRKNKFEMCTNVVNKTSISETVIMEVKRNKLKKKSYAREFKLTVVTWFLENGKNIHQTSQHFNLDKSKFVTG